MKVLVVDDDERVRERLGTWVCAEGAEVVLVDVHLAVYGGARWPRQVPFALTTGPYDEVSPLLADALGASGVIAKDAPGLRALVRRLAAGEQVVAAGRERAPVRFSPLEREIMRLVSEGLTNGEIAVRVHLSQDTVKQHTRALYARLGVSGRASAVDLVRRLGVLPAQRTGRISPREHEVLRVLATGATNAEIARRLGLSPHTVKQHTCSIYRKLGARNRAQAAMRIPAGTAQGGPGEGIATGSSWTGSA
jgi:DNA-binding NarL/FixJ family response regulator